MTDAEPQKLSLLAKLAVAFILMLIVAGVVWHGVLIATFQRIWHDRHWGLAQRRGPEVVAGILPPASARRRSDGGPRVRLGHAAALADHRLAHYAYWKAQGRTESMYKIEYVGRSGEVIDKEPADGDIAEAIEQAELKISNSQRRRPQGSNVWGNL